MQLGSGVGVCVQSGVRVGRIGVDVRVTGRNAAQRGFHPTRKHSTGWFKVPPAVPLSPAMLFSTRVSAGMKPPLPPPTIRP